MAGYGPVERATRAELRALGISVQTSILAANAVALARHIDSCRGAVAAAAASAQLRATRAELAAEAANAPERDVIDDLNARRAARRAAG
jgi:hypothetical protein